MIEYNESDGNLWSFAVGANKNNMHPIKIRTRCGLNGTFAEMIEFVSDFVPDNNLFAGGKAENEENIVEWKIFCKKDDNSKWENFCITF